MLPTPVLRLLNVLDDDYLENEEEYEGNCFLNCILMSFVANSKVDISIHKMSILLISILKILSYMISKIPLFDSCCRLNVSPQNSVAKPLSQV